MEGGGLVLVRNYEKYLRSDWWQIVRRAALSRAGYKCERCGKKGRLDVHHKHYDSLGKEDIKEDVAVLCRNCHKKADQERIIETVYERAFETWARKVYGEEWYLHYDASDIGEEFEQWLEEKEDDYY